jgi:hypothetical protein
MNLKEKLLLKNKELIILENEYFVLWKIKKQVKVKWIKNLYNEIIEKESWFIQKKGDYYKDLYFRLS